MTFVSSIRLTLLILCWSSLCHVVEGHEGLSKGEQTTELKNNGVEDNLDISEAKMNQVIEEIIDREREMIWTVTQMDDEESCSKLRERVIVQRVAEPCPDFQSKGDRGQISKYYY